MKSIVPVFIGVSIGALYIVARIFEISLLEKATTLAISHLLLGLSGFYLLIFSSAFSPAIENALIRKGLLLKSSKKPNKLIVFFLTLVVSNCFIIALFMAASVFQK